MDLSAKLRQEIILIDQKFLNYYWNDQQWADYISAYENQSYVFLKQKEGMTISFALFMENELDNSLHLLKIVTHPLYRGEGCGTELLAAAFDYLRHKAKPEPKVFLEVSVNNTIAIKLYEKLGFSRTRFVKKFYSDGSDALEMIKLIE